jgi:hypothetical protein
VKIRLPNERAYDRADQAGRSSGYTLFSSAHCCVCGARIVRRAEWLLLTRELDGSQEYAISHPEDVPAEMREHNLWVAPIGADCLRQHPELQPLTIARSKGATR